MTGFERWQDAVDDLEDTLIAVQNSAAHSHWPVVALACALADAGILDKARLLKITDALIGYATAEATGNFGEVDEAVRPLTEFRDVLEELRLEPGKVVEEVRLLEAGAGLLAVRRSKRSKPPSE